MKAVVKCMLPSLPFLEHTIYILVAEVLLALWSTSIVHVSCCAYTLTFGICIYTLAMPVANSGGKAIVLLSLNANRQNF